MYTHATLHQREIPSFGGDRNLFSFFLSNVMAGVPHGGYRDSARLLGESCTQKIEEPSGEKNCSEIEK